MSKIVVLVVDSNKYASNVCVRLQIYSYKNNINNYENNDTERRIKKKKKKKKKKGLFILLTTPPTDLNTNALMAMDRYQNRV